MIGTTLGPYEIVEVIGHGGMATVYRAYQRSMRRSVALKVIRRDATPDDHAIRRFSREAELIAQLEHPHILPVYDFNGEHDPPYIVMRYLPSGTLRHILERGSLDLHEVALIIAQVGSALDYAHELGVIHRDVKPSNILIDAKGNAFLTDFGIARMVAPNAEHMTGTGTAVGTPGYMAPEQVVGEKVDGRADVYALAIMTYELLTGTLPYQAELPMAVLYQHIHAPVPYVRAARPDLPAEINTVMQRGMAKQAVDRYPTAGEFSQALQAALNVGLQATPRNLRAIAGATIQERERRRTERTTRDATLHTPDMPISALAPEPTTPPARATRLIPRRVRNAVLAMGGGLLVVLLLALGVYISQNNSQAVTTPQQTQIAVLALSRQPAPTDEPTVIATTHAVMVIPRSTATSTAPPTHTVTHTATTAPSDTPISPTPTASPTASPTPTLTPTSTPTIDATPPEGVLPTMAGTWPTQAPLLISTAPTIEPNLVNARAFNERVPRRVMTFRLDTSRMTANGNGSTLIYYTLDGQQYLVVLRLTSSPEDAYRRFGFEKDDLRRGYQAVPLGDEAMITAPGNLVLAVIRHANVVLLIYRPTARGTVPPKEIPQTQTLALLAALLKALPEN